MSDSIKDAVHRAQQGPLARKWEAHQKGCICVACESPAPPAPSGAEEHVCTARCDHPEWWYANEAIAKPYRSEIAALREQLLAANEARQKVERQLLVIAEAGGLSVEIANAKKLHAERDEAEEQLLAANERAETAYKQGVEDAHRCEMRHAALDRLEARADAAEERLAAVTRERDEFARGLDALFSTRAGKLLKRGENFFVVKASEPYADSVALLIRAFERFYKKWTLQDETLFASWLGEGWVERAEKTRTGRRVRADAAEEQLAAAHKALDESARAFVALSSGREGVEAEVGRLNLVLKTRLRQIDAAKEQLRVCVEALRDAAAYVERDGHGANPRGVLLTRIDAALKQARGEG